MLKLEIEKFQESQEQRKKERRVTLRKTIHTKSLLGAQESLLLPSAPNKFEHRSYSAIDATKKNDLHTEYSPTKKSEDT